MISKRDTRTRTTIVSHACTPGDTEEIGQLMRRDGAGVAFFSEVSNFIDCIEGGPDPHILSSFEDATKTYERVSHPLFLVSTRADQLLVTTCRLTWAIRRASEASAAARLQMAASDRITE
jgi:hypothetical protein